MNDFESQLQSSQPAAPPTAALLTAAYEAGRREDAAQRNSLLPKLALAAGVLLAGAVGIAVGAQWPAPGASSPELVEQIEPVTPDPSGERVRPVSEFSMLAMRRAVLSDAAGDVRLDRLPISPSPASSPSPTVAGSLPTF